MQITTYYGLDNTALVFI